MKSRLISVLILLTLSVGGLILSGEKKESVREPEGQKKETLMNESIQESSQNRWLDRFYIGAVHNRLDMLSGYKRFDTLGFNLWHSYTVGELDVTNNRHYPFMQWPDGSISNDKLLNSVSLYKDSVNSKIINIRNANPDIRVVTMRPKIEYLCYGQRSDYQCEPVLTNEDLWFYAFNDHPTGFPESDSGAMVMHCRTIPSNAVQDNPGFVVKGLRANTEQCRVQEGGNEWQGDSECDWILKPRIRIPVNFPVTNPETPVCNIKVYSQDGETDIKNVDIKAKYFKVHNGIYDGSYIEEFNFVDPGIDLKISTNWGANWGYSARGTPGNTEPGKNEADIQVYWYGNCDMWIDYVRVDNDVADELHKGLRDNWIQDEVEQIGMLTHGGSEPMFMKYYLETLEFNHLPCAAYVNERIKYYSQGKIDLIQDLTNTISTHVPWKSSDGCDRTSIENADFLKEHYIEKVGFTQVFTESYPLTGCFSTDKSKQYFSRIPGSLPVKTPDYIIARELSPSVYDDSLQDNLYHEPYVLENGYNDDDPACDNCGGYTLRQDRGNFRFRLELGDALSKLADIPFIIMPQIHQWFRVGEVRREPTNEELNMMLNTSLCYGVKGILYFAYNSIPIDDEGMYGTGIADNSGNLRLQNYYGQTNPNKLQILQGISERVAERWGPYLIKFDNENRKTVIYNFTNDRNNFLNETYLADIVTYKQTELYPDCNEDNPGGTNPTGLKFECKNERYIQAATFKTSPYDGREYFILVNRRCSPYINDYNPDSIGGKRYVRIKFDMNYSGFSNFNNWAIVDLYNDSIVAAFDKSTGSLIDLGWYMPGEGKLYTILPVMETGGTLVCDENVTTSFTCKGEVIAEDKVVNIGDQITISFTSNGGFNFSGGEFHSGNPAQSGIPGPVFTSVSGQKWNGIKLTDGIKSYISKSTFNNIKQDENAIEFYDCADIKVTNSNFTCTQDENSGILMLNFTSNPSVEIRGPYIYQNTFTSNSSIYPAVEIISNASNVTPLLMEENTFTASEGENAVFLSGVTGGAIKCNSISNYSTGIQFLLSNLDIYNNTISSSLDSAKGIYGSGSGITIGADNYFLGGKNNISLSGNAGTDIKVEDSYFDMDGGKNLFNIRQNSGSYHLFGYFPEDYQGGEVVYCRGNCFKADNTAIDSAIWYITLGPEGDLMTFDFSEMDCNLDFTCNCEDEEVFELGDGINDTVCMTGQGMGGGEKVAVAVAGAVAAAGEEVVEYTVYKELKDSINVNTRKREYITLENQCRRILLQYPDSSGSREYIMKLYLSVLQQNDTTNQKMSALKSFLEQLITENPNNPKLIIRAFYVIQKCKVSLEEYTSALLGFQYIMNTNPYSIEGLLSSWDYAVVHMLIGSGGAERDEEIKDEPKDSLIFHIVKSEKTEKSKEQSKIKYYRGIESVLQSENSKQEERIRNFEKKNEKLEKPVGNRSIGKEDIEILKKIKEAVKIKKPKSREEHIKIVNTDIRNIFGTKSKQPGTNVKNIIPTEYSLSQNYPNPFNPVTKISFALPKESKVKLIIYDMLGREVARLINNENLSAGTYIREFNGSNLASGVYFLRILVNDGKDFTDVKKIVLLK